MSCTFLVVYPCGALHVYARSRARGYRYLGNNDGKLFNDPIYILAKVINAVMSSAADAECGSLYINASDAVHFIIILWGLEHQHRPVPIKTDNSTADGIMNRTMKRKRSEAFDMKHWWLVDCVE